MQLFHPVTNVLSRATVFGFVAAVVFAFWLVGVIYRSDYVTEVNVARPQPVQFSHQHHVGALGIDCRYCHASVEVSAFAGLPNTRTCMNCHSQIWADSPMLAPVRESWRTGRPLAWTRVHDLADFAYFDHSIHVAKGVACVTCHGQVERMPLMWKTATLFMEWCLSCHRNPGPSLSRPEDVFLPEPRPRTGAAADVSAPTNCTACHR